MKMHLHTALLAAALTATSVTAHASQTDITVWADVDPNLNLLRADGSALPAAVKLEYIPGGPSVPGGGLKTWEDQVRIHSNDEEKDVAVRLANDPALISLRPGAASVPLAVSLNRKVLTVAAQDFTASDLFDGALPGASIAMPLTIGQATPGPITVAGRYEGMVSIVLAQKTASP